MCPIRGALVLVGRARFKITSKNITRKVMNCFEIWKWVFSHLRIEISLRRSLSVSASSPNTNKYLPISIFSSLVSLLTSSKSGCWDTLADTTTAGSLVSVARVAVAWGAIYISETFLPAAASSFPLYLTISSSSISYIWIPSLAASVVEGNLATCRSAASFLRAINLFSFRQWYNPLRLV